jgi:hypothetical protein
MMSIKTVQQRLGIVGFSDYMSKKRQQFSTGKGYANELVNNRWGSRQLDRHAID